jgi:ATP-binding protein involved in chromosome partitioning
MVIVTTPARAAQKVAQRAADMAHRSFLPVIGVIENMSTFVCDHGESYALFGEGGGAALAEAIGAPLLGHVPIEPAVALGNDAGEPVALDGEGPAAVAFREIAARLRDEVAPPAAPSDAAMAGCSARMLDAVAAAFDD